MNVLQYMTDNTIREILSSGENINVEFKSTDVHTDALAREMTAFSNSYGGTIFIGVDDDGGISGIDEKKKWDEYIANIARNNITPAINPLISSIQIDDTTILALEIRKGENKPYQTAIDGKYWIRILSTVRQATAQELMRLFQASGFFHFDINPIENTSFDSLNQKKLRAYFGDTYKIDWEGEKNKIRLLINSSILSEQDSKVVATVGGLLCFCDEPEHYLPQASIQVAVIKGIHITDEVVQKKEITGSLPEQIDNAVSFMRLHIPEPLVVIESARRENTLAISVSVLREAVVNAVCHRDYSIQTRKIHLYIYSDRIELTSPGRIANTLDLEKIRYGNSAPRNIFLLKLLDNLHYIDGLGRGIPLMIRELKDRVAFFEEGELFTVVMKF